jgi:hypothetical protein
MKRQSDLKLMRKQLEKDNAKRPEILTPLPKEKWPEDRAGSIIEVWLSKTFIVQVHQEPAGILRLSCNRTSMDQFGGWEQNLSWDELMEIKRQVGHGESFAVEILPEDSQIVNVANMRHIWILPQPVCGWRKGRG